MRTMRQMQAAAKWDTGFDKPASEPPVRVQPDGSTDAELVSRMNKAEDCILYLRIQRLMTDGETDRIRRKINQRLRDASKARKASP